MISSKRLLSVVLLAAVLTFSVCGFAEEEQGPPMLSIIDVYVKNGHDAQFREGVAAWKDCYLEHEGESAWNVWRRMNGKGTVYAVVFAVANWAELDERDEAGTSCQNVVQDQIVPHTITVDSSYARLIPELSPEGPLLDVAVVTYFRVNDGRLFRQTVDAVNAAIVEEEGQARGYWYNVFGGGPKSPSMFVVGLQENFAQLDVSRDSPFALAAKALGEEAAEELWVDFRKSVDSVWQYLYRRNDDLSHNP